MSRNGRDHTRRYPDSRGCGPAAPAGDSWSSVFNEQFWSAFGSLHYPAPPRSLRRLSLMAFGLVYSDRCEHQRAIQSAN